MLAEDKLPAKPWGSCIEPLYFIQKKVLPVWHIFSLLLR
jgi:hypothetical protein